MRQKALVADGHEHVRNFVAHSLEHIGMDVVQVDNGNDAVMTIMQDRTLRLAVLDVRLPGRSGIDVVRITRLARPGVRLLLMVSRDVDPRDAAELGVPFLKRPFDLDALASAVKAP